MCLTLQLEEALCSRPPVIQLTDASQLNTDSLFLFLCTRVDRCYWLSDILIFQPPAFRL